MASKPPSSRPIDPATQHLSFQDVLVAYREFLEVVFHSLLFIRRVYPAALFLQRSKWGVAAQRASHPEVESYISNALDLVLEEVGKVRAGARSSGSRKS